MAMTNGDLRAQALRGPWTCHTYARMISNVEWHDDEGNAINVCAYWDDRFGAILAQAWAVPQLVAVLRQISDAVDLYAVALDGGEPAAVEWAALLGALTAAAGLAATLESAR